MATEDFLVDDGRDWKTVETIGECFPKFDVVASFAFVIETVDTVDRRTFVISSQEEEVLGIFDLASQEKEVNRKTLNSRITL